METLHWTCTAWGVTASGLVDALRRTGAARHLLFDEAGDSEIVIEEAGGQPLVRARLAADLPIPAAEISAALSATVVVDEVAIRDSVEERRVEMVALGTRAFLERWDERGMSLRVGTSSMELVVPNALALRHARATLRRALALELGAAAEQLLELDEAGCWAVAPTIGWNLVSTLRCRDPKSSADRLFDAALANAPPGLAEAAGWPPQPKGQP